MKDINRPTPITTINSGYANWFAERFNGKRSCSIRFDVDLRTVPTAFRDEELTKLVRKLRNNLSRFYFGNAVRLHQRYADMTAALHKGQFFEGRYLKPEFHELGQTHLHIVAEMPDDQSLDEVRQFTKLFVAKNHPLTVASCYVEDTRTSIGSQRYNGRFGPDSWLLF